MEGAGGELFFPGRAFVLRAKFLCLALSVVMGVYLIDHNMPGKTGLWFMKHAAMPRTTKTLLMTGEVNPGVIKEMFELGASGYLIKPFNEDELARHIDFHSCEQVGS